MWVVHRVRWKYSCDVVSRPVLDAHKEELGVTAEVAKCINEPIAIRN